MRPTPSNGKVCYIEMPSTDIQRSADFYEEVFGWRIRRRGDGHPAFDDTTGEVSGTWVLGRPPAAAPGLLIYIMVDSVAATVARVPTCDATTPDQYRTKSRVCSSSRQVPPSTTVSRPARVRPSPVRPR